MTVVLSILLVAAAALIVWQQLAMRRRGEEDSHARQRLTGTHQRGLEQQQQRTSALFNSMAEGVLVLDSHGLITQANSAMRQLFALRDDCIGRSVIEALRHHQVHELARRTLAGEAALHEEIELTALGADSRFMAVNCARLSASEDFAGGAILVFHDITRLRVLERSRTEFIGNVSHELRTPLSIIKGYAETLATIEADAASVQKYASIIERHADRLTALVDDLLTISGLETHQITLSPADIEPRPIAQRVVDELTARAASRGVTVENRIPAASRCLADPGRLQQVLTNLIENAIKYGREQGTVVVDAATANNELLLTITDDGPGIPEEARARVFERFYRLDKGRSRDQGGTGLGLAIVKHIAIAHQGRAWVEGNPVGSGARFCVALPVK